MLLLTSSMGPLALLALISCVSALLSTSTTTNSEPKYIIISTYTIPVGVSNLTVSLSRAPIPTISTRSAISASSTRLNYSSSSSSSSSRRFSTSSRSPTSSFAPVRSSSSSSSSSVPAQRFSSSSSSSSSSAPARSSSSSSKSSHPPRSTTSTLRRPTPTPETLDPPPEHPTIFLDFDGTIAIPEGFEPLLNAAYKTLSNTTTIPPRSNFTDEYNEDVRRATFPHSHRQTIQGEIAWQRNPDLTAAEIASFERVRASGLFANATVAALAHEASLIFLRPGFWEFVAAARERNATVSILSRNWSVRWIRTVLRASEPPGTGLAEYIYIYCPEILPDGLLPACDRDRPTNIFSGTDKRMVLMHGVEERAAVGEEVVFVGDDNSDLEPIMMFPTAIGIVAGRNSGSAVTIGSDWAMRSTRTGKWSGRKGRYPQRKRFGEAGLWSAADGWRGRTADTEKAYTLEDYRELVYILGWE